MRICVRSSFCPIFRPNVRPYSSSLFSALFSDPILSAPIFCPYCSPAVSALFPPMFFGPGVSPHIFPKPKSQLCPGVGVTFGGGLFNNFPEICKIIKSPEEAQKTRFYCMEVFHWYHEIGFVLQFDIPGSFSNSTLPKSKHLENCRFVVQKGPPAPMSICWFQG